MSTMILDGVARVLLTRLFPVDPHRISAYHLPAAPPLTKVAKVESGHPVLSSVGVPHADGIVNSAPCASGHSVTAVGVHELLAPEKLSCTDAPGPDPIPSSHVAVIFVALLYV